MKNVKRGKGGRFANTAQPGQTEEVKAKGGRRVSLKSSDSEDEALAKAMARARRQQKKTAKSPHTSATRTGTTPPVSPSKGQTSETVQEPNSPMDTSTAPTLVTSPVSPIVSRPTTLKPTNPSEANIDEIISQLDKEPGRACNYGKTESSNCLEDNRPQRTRKAPTRFGCALTY